MAGCHRRSVEGDMRRAAAALTVTLASLACGESAPMPPGSTIGDLVTESRSVGDTTVVHTVQGSVWGGPMTVEPLVTIGAVDGPPEHLFGSISMFTVGPLGDVWVYDRQATELRQFDSLGVFQRVVAQGGEGPGELRSPTALVPRPSGGVVVVDRSLPGIIEFGRDGSLIRSVVTAALGVFDGPVVIAEGDELRYVRGDRLSQSNFGPAAVDAVALTTGVANSTPLPGIQRISWVPGLNHPPDLWALSPSGEIVRAATDRYEVDVFREDGTVFRMSRAFVPMAHPAAEVMRLEELLGTTIDPVKPPIAAFHIDPDGDILLRVHTAAIEVPNPWHGPERPDAAPTVWIEPTAIDAFRPDGTYLGRAGFPQGSGFSAVMHHAPDLTGARIWVVMTDELGVHSLRRFQIVPERSGEVG